MAKQSISPDFSSAENGKKVRRKREHTRAVVLDLENKATCLFWQRFLFRGALQMCSAGLGAEELQKQSCEERVPVPNDPVSTIRQAVSSLVPFECAAGPALNSTPTGQLPVVSLLLRHDAENWVTTALVPGTLAVRSRANTT
jgi:hypothetical protein